MRRLGLCLLLAGGMAQGAESEQVFAAVRASVVTLVALDETGVAESEGSGVVVAPARVVTNCHVVEDLPVVRVTAAARRLEARLVRRHAASDLCLLEVPGLAAPAAQPRPFADIRVGEAAHAVGNPLGFGLAVSSGIVAALPQGEDRRRVITTAPISPGSSGGGLFDAQGRLLGITTRVFSLGQNLNTAVPADLLQSLSAADEVPPPPPNPGPETKWQEEAFRLQRAGDWSALEELAWRWTGRYPTSPDAAAALALALVNLARSEEATRLLTGALQAHPRHALLHAYLALARNGEGARDAALDSVERAIGLAPATAYFHRLRSEILEAAGRKSEALAAGRQAVRLDPGEVSAWLAVGRLEHGERRWDEALLAFQRAARLAPDDEAAKRAVASLQAMQGRSSEAQRTLSGLEQGGAQDALTWYNIGWGHFVAKRFADAERALRRALELDGHHGESWLTLAQILEGTGRQDEARQAYLNATRDRPKLAQAWLGRGLAARRSSDAQEAAASLARAAELDPAVIEAWRSLGVVRGELGQHAAAVVALERLVGLEPNAAGNWFLLGTARLRAGNRAAALQALAEAEKLAPNDANVLMALSMWHGQGGDHPRSLAYDERAVAADPASPSAWSNRGYSLIKLGRHAEAVKSLQTAVNLQPDFANAWINLGEAHLRNKELGAAIRALERALTLSPQAVDARIFLTQAYAASGQLDRAEALAEALVRDRPDFAPAEQMRLAILLAAKKGKEALVSYRRLKALDPLRAADTRAKAAARGISLPE